MIIIMIKNIYDLSEIGLFVSFVYICSISDGILKLFWALFSVGTFILLQRNKFQTFLRKLKSFSLRSKASRFKNIFIQITCISIPKKKNINSVHIHYFSL